MLEADDPAGSRRAEPRPAFPGDERTGVKDPLVRRVDGGWHAWICCHPLDVAGAEDRMITAYADQRGRPRRGTWHGTVLAGRPGAWDARGARLTAVLPDGRAAYDGRGHAEENWFERTGLAARGGGRLRRRGRAGGRRPLPRRAAAPGRRLPHLLRGAACPDESHELRTEYIA